MSMPPERARLRTAFGLLLFMGVTWGLTFSLARIAATGGAHPLGLTFWQALGGGATLAVACLLRRKPIRLTRPHLVFYLVCGLIGSVLPGACYFYAAAHIPAGILAITIALVPLMTYGLALLLRIDPPSLRRLAGILFGLAAMLLIIGPEAALPSPALVPWVLLAAVSAGCYACEGIYIALKRPADTDSVALVAGMLFGGALLITPVMLANDAFVALTLPWGPVEWSVAAMVLASASAYSAYLHVVQSAGPVFASQTGYLVTAFGVLWGLVIFGESHSPWIWAALAVMLAGLALVAPSRTSTAPA